MENIKRFFQPVILVNFILICICITGFIYQVYSIFDQYMLGKTVVNIEVKRLKDQTLPAITVCIAYRDYILLSLSKLRKLTMFNQEYYQDYMNLYKESYANKTFIKEVKNRLNKIYRHIMENFHSIIWIEY